MLPGIFEETILTRRVDLMPSLFLRPMHPKSEISPTAESIRKALEAGWVGQLKIHGHRAQIHISADVGEPILAYNRQGQLHKKAVSARMQSELRRLFAPEKGWTVIDGEWVKSEAASLSRTEFDHEKLYVFDFLKRNDESLHRLRYRERWELLPRAYISPVIQTLGILTTLDQCLDALARDEERLEGLVFKSPSPGFEDTSIVRCRRRLAN